MLLITLTDTTTFTEPNRHQNVSTEHYVTDMDLLTFIRHYNEMIAAVCEQYTATGMRSWWHLVNVVEVGHLSAKQIQSLESTHFPGKIWLEKWHSPRHFDQF